MENTQVQQLEESMKLIICGSIDSDTDAVERGMALLQRHAKQGNIMAQENLATFYFSDQFMKKDSAQGVYWCRQAIMSGSISAMYDLASHYMKCLAAMKRGSAERKQLAIVTYALLQQARDSGEVPIAAAALEHMLKTEKLDESKLNGMILGEALDNELSEVTYYTR